MDKPSYYQINALNFRLREINHGLSHPIFPYINAQKHKFKSLGRMQ